MAIYGENLASLAALKAGSGISGTPMNVDVIYIDPPYNVGGNQGYKNTWRGKSEKERDWAGDHGAFLDFMEPRLKIGRSLLTEEGVIFVSICDGEYCRLKILMDQIFGSQNCLGTIIWNKNQGSSGKHLAAVHEYILVYAKSYNKCPPLEKEKEAAQMMIEKAHDLKNQTYSYTEAQIIFKQWVNDKKKEGVIGSGESPYRLLHPETFRPFSDTPSCAQDKPETRYNKPIKHPITNKPCSVPKKGWKWKKDTLLKMVKYDSYIKGDNFVIAGQLVYGKDETKIPRKLQYLDEKMEQIFPSVIKTSYGGDKDLPSGISFSTPKPVQLIKILLKSYPRKDVVVLDYFAGSASTAQATHELNTEDGGNRSWIMIEEMGSTFHKVLLPRIQHFNENFGIFKTETAAVGNKQLLKAFEQYSFDFLSAYHNLDDSSSIKIEGINVLGYDDKTSRLIAMTVPTDRKNVHHFEEELAAIKAAVKSSRSKSVMIYTINRHNGKEEPWLGVDKSILSGTPCRKLDIIEIPDQLIDEWNEVLIGMAA